MAAEAGLTLLAGGTVLSAKAQLEAGKTEEELRKRNAAIMEAESEREARAAGEQAGLKRAEKARLLARQTVRFAKGGVRAGLGTPVVVAEDSLRRIEQQAQVLQERGQFAREFGTQRAAIERAAGKSARRASRLGAGATLATGFGTAFLLAGQGGGAGAAGKTPPTPGTQNPFRIANSKTLRRPRNPFAG